MFASNPSGTARLNDEQVELVETHLPLIGYHVNEIAARIPQHVSRDDLASAGSLALVRAAVAYDAATGVPFARYAAIRLRGALLDELRSMDWASRGTRSRVRRLATVTEELTAQLGRTPTREHLAQTLGVDVSEIDQTRDDAGRRVLSIEAFDGAVSDLLPDRAPDPEASVVATERLRYLRAAVAALPERLRLVVQLVYFEDRTVTEVAGVLGVTQSRVSQLRAEATSLMREALDAHLEAQGSGADEAHAGVAQRRRRAYVDAVGQTAAPARNDLAVLASRAAAVPAAHAAAVVARTARHLGAASAQTAGTLAALA
ncbi:sigma-70 family RNA polymerase sigma factor [Sanguibacter sp. HDW7]|uniref:sigma-70 family RNA polymerase sigma factor n=1 Tax=Sanguibacter sp. HDW7 TaxID=2714931 RepID=UPI00140B2895|nr:sigma-70 family RNA polymerase sigma factor [Sanguibacter sp. HDW7]QIK84316.1 sigma-70 family RNA polymerase sigma factor [Sanguibacter sp. HDW7]